MWTTSALLDELRRLVALPSHEDPTPVLTYLQQRLPFLPWQQVPVDTAPTGRPMFNLYARPEAARVVLNTHVDTVPPLGMRDPFTLHVRDGRAYGRGAVDTKGLLAALVMAVEAFWHRHGQMPAAIALTVDEENTSARGSATLAPYLRGSGPIIVLEPTQGRVCTRQAGALEFALEARGRSVHAAEAARGVNPLHLLIRWVGHVEDELGLPLRVLMLQGGWEHYAVPPRARLLAEIPVAPGQRWAPIEARIQRSLGQPPWRGWLTYTRIDAEDPWDFGEHSGTRWLRAAYRAALGHEPETGIMPSWTDAANFARHGLPCVVFGFGDLAVAHTDREHIAIADLERMARVLYQLFSILTQNPSATG